MWHLYAASLPLGRVLEKNGQIRLDEFAIRSDVHIAITQWYLNYKARQSKTV